LNRVSQEEGRPARKEIVAVQPLIGL
jgi:hypothetical protein